MLSVSILTAASSGTAATMPDEAGTQMKIPENPLAKHGRCYTLMAAVFAPCTAMFVLTTRMSFPVMSVMITMNVGIIFKSS